MSLVLRVSTSSFEFSFLTRSFLRVFKWLQKPSTGARLSVQPSVHLWFFWALLPVSSFRESDMTAGWEVPYLIAERVYAGFGYWPGVWAFEVSWKKGRLCSPLQPTKHLCLHMRCWPWADCQVLEVLRTDNKALVRLPEQLSRARTVQTDDQV